MVKLLNQVVERFVPSEVGHAFQLMITGSHRGAPLDSKSPYLIQPFGSIVNHCDSLPGRARPTPSVGPAGRFRTVLTTPHVRSGQSFAHCDLTDPELEVWNDQYVAAAGHSAAWLRDL